MTGPGVARRVDRFTPFVLVVSLAHWRTMWPKVRFQSCLVT
jgi:hypothetical protein